VTRVVIDPGVLVSAFISPRKAAPALLVDAFLIALAQAHNADAVVSGDGHLLDVTSSDLPVLTPRELADRLGLSPPG